MTSARANADLVLMALGLGAVSLAYAAGAFVLGLVLHPPGRQAWSAAEILAVGVYPLGWVGLGWGASALWLRARARSERPRA